MSDQLSAQKQAFAWLAEGVPFEITVDGLGKWIASDDLDEPFDPFGYLGRRGLKVRKIDPRDKLKVGQLIAVRDRESDPWLLAFFGQLSGDSGVSACFANGNYVDRTFQFWRELTPTERGEA